MAQKVNPISLRLQQTNREFDNCWYTNYFYRKLVSRDIYINHYLNNFLKLIKTPSARFSLQYSTKSSLIFTFLCYPKQSRFLKSKMFGIVTRKIRKKNFRQKKPGKFLLDSVLWSRISNPFNSSFFSSPDKKLLMFTPFVNGVGVFLSKKTTNSEILSFINGVESVSTDRKKLIEKKNIVEKNNKQLNRKKNNRHFFDSQFLTREYKKNSLLFFLFFYLLHNGYNNSRFQKKNSENIFLNSFFCFSHYQPISLFYTTFLNKKPINFLVKNKTLGSSKYIYFEKNKLKNSLTFHCLQENFSPFQHNSLFINKKEGFSTKNKKNIYSQNSKQTSLFFLFYHFSSSQLKKHKYFTYFQNFLSSQFHVNTELLPFKVSDDWQGAGFLADEIVYFLERRVSFRRLKRQIIKKIAINSTIRGVRITCSGRVGGKSKKAQRAKTDCVKYGQTSRHTFSSRIDFAARTARTIFGSVGVKVWICYK